jgi:hypothetical protein
MSTTASRIFYEKVRTAQSGGRSYQDAVAFTRMTEPELVREMNQEGKTLQAREIEQRRSVTAANEHGSGDRRKVQQDFVNEVMEQRKCSYHEAYKTAMILHPEAFVSDARSTSQGTVAANEKKQNKENKSRVREQQAFVNELMNSKGLDYNRAWIAASKERPELFQNDLANDVPPGVKIVAEGQQLVPNWPPPASRLLELGLPLNVTREQYDLWQAAADAEITPEVAAYVIKIMLQSEQILKGTKFDDIFEFLKGKFPELFLAAKKWQPKKQTN